MRGPSDGRGGQRSRRLARDARRSVPRVRDGTRGERLRGLLPVRGRHDPRPGSRWAPVDGWPVQMPGAIASVGWNDFSIGCGAGSAIQLGSDASVYVAISAGSAAKVHVFNPDGRPRAGWPQTILRVTRPGRTAGVVTAAAVSPWRTTMASWRGATTTSRRRSNSGRAGPSSLPGQPTARSVRAGPRVDGKRRRGRSWIASVGSPTSARPARCGATMTPVRSDAWLAVSAGSAGTAVCGARRSRRDHPGPRSGPPTRSLFLGRNGRPIGGTPIDLPGDIETQCLFGDTPCAGIVFPAFADDGTMYISLHSSTPEHANPDNSTMGGAIVALDVDGRVGLGGRSTWPLGRTPLGCRWTSTIGWWPRVSCVASITAAATGPPRPRWSSPPTGSCWSSGTGTRARCRRAAR